MALGCREILVSTRSVQNEVQNNGQTTDLCDVIKEYQSKLTNTDSTCFGTGYISLNECDPKKYVLMWGVPRPSQRAWEVMILRASL